MMVTTIISFALAAVGIAACCGKIGGVPDSISAMVYELPKKWQWMWTVWLCLVAMACQTDGNLYFTHPDRHDYTTSFPVTTAHHIALVRNGSLVKFFVDGTNVNQVSFDGSSYYYWMIRMCGPAVFDELRISNIARYS